ncbi:MAG: TVP38/TMEM64 family protein [Ectobacillus sp.]
MAKIFSLIAAAATILFITFNGGVFQSIAAGDIDSIQAFLAANMWYALVITLVTMIIQNTFTIIPLLLVITLNILLFGFFYRFLWSWATSVIAAAIVFAGVRYFFQDWVLKRIDSDLIAKAEQNGLRYVVEGRIFPFIPTSLVNIVAGLSSIHFKHFLLGTIVGNFVYFFALALIPAGLLSAHVNEYIIGGVLAIFIILFYLSKLIYNRRKKNSKKNVSM